MIYTSTINSNRISKGTHIQLRNGLFGIVFDNEKNSKIRLVKINQFPYALDIKEILSASVNGEWRIIKYGNNN